MQGYKTYTGIFLTFLGILGWGDLFTGAQVSELVNLVTQLIGVGLAIYGNYKAHREITAMGGYR